MSIGSIERIALDILSRALDVASDERAAWVRDECAGDKALEARVLALLSADNSNPAILKTGGARNDAVEPAAPEGVGAYRVTEIIGQGGMGAVYKGARVKGNFDQTVAIKIIRPGVLSEPLIERFERERQVLATLNHPNIARLYDGGEMDDGSPYMIMEYVDGEPLLAWAERTNADFDERLGLFSNLCNAVQFAHQNLIIHRDITPSNVLVNRDGHVKLIDFGISKSPEPQLFQRTHSTSEGASTSLSYTPGYAAPERSRGAAANTLSDIFSLGKLLKDLIKAEDLTPEMNAIIRRAAADDPADRYPSVDALEEDLQNLRTGHPVSAFNGSVSYRFGKFIKRHRITVVSIAGVIIGLSAALATTAAQYQRAETALAIANERFSQARHLSRTLVFDVYDETQRVSGTMEARRKLANVVRDYVTGLELDAAAPDDVLLEVGIISSRLADLYGGVGIANLGENEVSNQLFQEARSALEHVLARNPEDAVAIAELIMVERMLTMQALYHDGDMPTAYAANTRAAQLAEKGLSLNLENERPILRHMWSVRTDQLQLLLREKRTSEALELVRGWRAELTPEMNERLGNAGEMDAYFAMQEASILLLEDNGAEAIPALEKTISHRQSELIKSPENYYQKTQLMVAHGEMATAQRLAGDLALSRDHADRAVELAREIMDDDPDDAGGPEGLSAMLQKKATAEAFSDNQSAARQALRAAAVLLEQLIEKFPGDTFYEVRLLNVLSQAVEIDQAAGGRAWSCGLIADAATYFDVENRLAESLGSEGSVSLAPLLSADCR